MRSVKKLDDRPATDDRPRKFRMTISTMDHPIHFMFGSNFSLLAVWFSGSADRVLLAVELLSKRRLQTILENFIMIPEWVIRSIFMK